MVASHSVCSNASSSAGGGGKCSFGSNCSFECCCCEAEEEVAEDRSPQGHPLLVGNQVGRNYNY